MDLELFDDLDFYRGHFMDAALWEPWVRLACRQAGLPCQAVSPTLPGSYPTFIVDQRWVVKLFGRLFDGVASFQVELHANRVIAACPELLAPRLVAQGVLFQDCAGWGWPYLIFDYLPGVSLGQVFSQLTLQDQQAVAAHMGRLTCQLHRLPIVPGAVFSSSWEPLLPALEQLIAASPASHRRWGTLPGRLVEQVQGFLSPPADLLDLHRSPFMIHADLTRDHLLGRFAAGRWHSLGLIDWGDANQFGFFYELAALFLDMFQAERRLLPVYLEAYGLSPDLRRDFPRRALSAALVHRFNVFEAPWIARRPELFQSSTLEQLALRLYGEV